MRTASRTVASDTEFTQFLAELWDSQGTPEIPYGPGSYPRSAYERSLLQNAISRGMTNENLLANLVFFDRHPERNGRLISREGDGSNFQKLSEEWLRIRDTQVRPLLRDPSPPPPFVPPASPSPPVAGPPTRICCLLAERDLIGTQDLGAHRTRGGIIYTGKAGFIDAGHVRHTADVTAFVYQQIHAAKGASGTKIGANEGEARLTRLVPLNEWLAVARSIAYDDAMGHEIMTYWCGRCTTLKPVPGGHNSAFSPEDLCSNYLGTVVAERALTAGGTFDAAASTAFLSMLADLNAQSLVETHNAFRLIENTWVDINRLSGSYANCYLRRRNFTRNPWKARHRSDAPTPAFVTADLSVTTGYDYTHTATFPPILPTFTRAFTRADFPTEIDEIKRDAGHLYGLRDFDKPW